eukprot:GILI01023358.1.p1 GENE.GILI01023358.1~~GILI01023358.1.p1  ORF type:complete len:285 (+),score=37.94 GILI01023358.1:173-1027(+)
MTNNGNALPLLEKIVGADVRIADAQGYTLLHMAASRGPYHTDNKEFTSTSEEEYIITLIAAGADIDAATLQGLTALHIAVQNKNDVALALLLDCGAKVNTTNLLTGCSPLYDAVTDGTAMAVVRLMSVKGIDLSTVDLYGCTPLHAAFNCYKMEAALALISAGADVQRADSSGFTPLHIASAESFVAAVLQLLARGADVNARNADWQTALHDSVVHDASASVTQALLAAGADVDALTQDCYQNELSSLDLASRRDFYTLSYFGTKGRGIFWGRCEWNRQARPLG